MPRPPSVPFLFVLTAKLDLLGTPCFLDFVSVEWLQRAINGPFVAISRPCSSELVNQGCIKLGHIQGDVLELFYRDWNGHPARPACGHKMPISGLFEPL